MAASSEKDEIDERRAHSEVDVRADHAAAERRSDPAQEASGVHSLEGGGTAAIPLVGAVRRTVPARARASLALSGLHATSPEALRRRLIGPWAEGLRQYLTLQLGDARRGANAFNELKRLVLSTPTSALVREPGAKAHVYRLARRVALDKLRASPRTEGGELPYRAPDSHRDRVARLRAELTVEHAELLELRYARELMPHEIACVLDLVGDWDGPGAVDLGPTERALGEAQRAARALIDADALELGELSNVLVAAFALIPQVEDAEPRETDREGLEPGTLIGGRYRLLSRVGVGAFGDVYKADDQDVPGHRVALKLLREPALSQASRDEALRELKLIAAVMHPSVVLFKDHGWYEDRLWFVMPWYDGATLDKHVRESGGISREEARAIFEPLARALATLHANGIRHQDIKPDNVLLARIRGFAASDGSPEVLPILIDLGVAAKEHEALIGGTPLYFAPEVAAHYAEHDDAREIGTAADVFALALSLRNALEPETEEDVPAGAIEAFIERRAQKPPAPPSRRELRYLRSSFERWLSPDPAKRPTAEELVRELAILTEPEQRRATRRRTASWLGPLLLALLAVFGAVVFVYQREAEQRRHELLAAREATEAARADLLVEAARLSALGSDHAELQRRLEAESLSVEELAAQLATGQRQIEILGHQLSASISARDALTAERDGLTHQLEEQTTRGSALEQRLAAETVRLGQLDAALGREREARASERDENAREQAALSSELAATRERVDHAAADLRLAREERDRSLDRVRQLETRLEATEAAHDQLESELARIRERLARLRQRVAAGAAASGGGAGAGTTSGEEHGPSPTGESGARATDHEPVDGAS